MHIALAPYFQAVLQKVHFHFSKNHTALNTKKKQSSNIIIDKSGINIYLAEALIKTFVGFSSIFKINYANSTNKQYTHAYKEIFRILQDAILRQIVTNYEEVYEDEEPDHNIFETEQQTG